MILPGPREKAAYDEHGYTAIRRAGDLVFISGVVIGRRPGESADVAAFKDQVRRGFGHLENCLRAAGLRFDHVIMINSFHVWQGPNFSGSRADQFKPLKKSRRNS